MLSDCSNVRRDALDDSVLMHLMVLYARLPVGLRAALHVLMRILALDAF